MQTVIPVHIPRPHQGKAVPQAPGFAAEHGNQGIAQVHSGALPREREGLAGHETQVIAMPDGDTVHPWRCSYEERTARRGHYGPIAPQQPIGGGQHLSAVQGIAQFHKDPIHHGLWSHDREHYREQGLAGTRPDVLEPQGGKRLRGRQQPGCPQVITHQSIAGHVGAIEADGQVRPHPDQRTIIEHRLGGDLHTRRKQGLELLTSRRIVLQVTVQPKQGVLMGERLLRGTAQAPSSSTGDLPEPTVEIAVGEVAVPSSREVHIGLAP